MLSSARVCGALGPTCCGSITLGALTGPNLTVPGPGQVRFKAVRVHKPKRATWFRQNLLEISKPVWTEEKTSENIWRYGYFRSKSLENTSDDYLPTVWWDDVNSINGGVLAHGNSVTY